MGGRDGREFDGRRAWRGLSQDQGELGKVHRAGRDVEWRVEVRGLTKSLERHRSLLSLLDRSRRELRCSLADEHVL